LIKFDLKLLMQITKILLLVVYSNLN